MNRYLGFQEETVRNENVLMTWICILLGYCSSRWFVAALSRSGTLYTLHGFQCSKIGPTQPLPAVAAQGTVINKKTIQSERRCWNQTNLPMCACNSCLIIMALRCHWLLCHWKNRFFFDVGSLACHVASNLQPVSILFFTAHNAQTSSR